jgi:hypothetical protein
MRSPPPTAATGTLTSSTAWSAGPGLLVGTGPAAFSGEPPRGLLGLTCDQVVT